MLIYFGLKAITDKTNTQIDSIKRQILNTAWNNIHHNIKETFF
jgi:hypothetical protein